MTVREVATALGVAPQTISRHIKAIRGESDDLRNVEKVENGKPVYLSEAEVTEIKLRIERSGRTDLESVQAIPSARTRLEKALIIKQAADLQAEIIAELEEEVALLAPRAAVADAIALASDCKTISEVGKITGIGPHKLGDLLEADGVLFRKHFKEGATGERVPYEVYMERGYFVVRERVFSGKSGEVHRRSQTYVTGKGEVWIAKKYQALIGGAV